MQKPKKTKQPTAGKERFEVLLEDMNSKFDVLIERTADIAPIKEDVETIKGDIEVIKTDIVIMKMDISTIKNDLKQKVDREEFKTLEHRVAMLEAQR